MDRSSKIARRLAALAPFAVAALLAGCGSSSSSSPASASSSALTLSETEFKISPATPAVANAGTITITVKNTGAVTHALAVQTPAGLVKTAAISPGSTATLVVDASRAGRYTFFCPIGHHRAAGMQGVLVVGSASGVTGAPASGTTVSSSRAMGY